jgi:hypothetical protein
MLVVTRRLVALSAAALMTVAALGACTQPSPEPSRSTAPTVKHTPAFASDADALKAATDAYAAYLKMSDTIFSQGGINPERIGPFVSKAMETRESSGYREFEKRGWKSTGTSTFDNVKVQQIDSVDRVPITLYLCLDVSGVDVVDADGQSVVSEERPDRSPVVAVFDLREGSRQLVVDSVDPWSGDAVC